VNEFSGAISSKISGIFVLKNLIPKHLFYFYEISGVDFQLRMRDHLTQQFHTYTPKCILYVFILHLADLA